VTAAEQDAPEAPVRDLPPVHVWPIGRVKESSRNPRRIPEQAVKVTAGSIRRFGWKQPLVVEADGTLIVGHTRRRAAASLGLTKVPVIIADDLTDEEVQAYRIADNRAGDFSSWDLPELAQQLAELEEDFAEVLALADWEAVTAEAQALLTGDSPSGGGGGGSVGGGGMTLDLPEEAAHFLDGGFQLHVCFRTKEEALAAEQTLMDLPGVFDVRHERG
jgi:hypothetical protein